MSTFGIQLQGASPADVASSPYDFLIIDNYDANGNPWSASQVAAMSANKVLGGYVSIGEAETYRPYWQASWGSAPPAWLGPVDPDWPGNYYVDIRSPAWVSIVKGEIQQMIAQGFEASYMDVIDVYYTPWFLGRVGSLAAAETAAKAYVKELAAYAHSLDPSFKFYVNGGEDLLADPTYLAAIDGVFKEQVYSGIGSNQNQLNAAADVAWTTQHLDLAKAAGKDVFVIHYATSDSVTETIVSNAEAAGYQHYEGPLDLQRVDYTGTTGADVLFDSAGNNLVRGLAGNDTLVSAAGNDTLSGGAGADVFAFTGGGADVITDFVKGTDRLNLSALGVTSLSQVAQSTNASGLVLTKGTATITLRGVAAGSLTDADLASGPVPTPPSDPVGNPNPVGTASADTLNGGAADDSLFGAAANDVLNGLGGNDTLDGGTGADTMTGGAGSDRYIVDDNGDRAVEANGVAGTDIVISTVSYNIGGSHLENLTLAGAAAINGTGNSIANVLTGNEAANLLSGLGGADSLVGNGGNDTLDGGTGADTMAGGVGSDTYYVDEAGDKALEANGAAGIDLVISSVTYNIGGSHLENLTLTGLAAINGTGNSIANALTGNEAANSLAGLGGNDTLSGAGGNDTLNGGAGTDRLTGGAGTDSFVFSSAADIGLGAGADRITDFALGEKIDLSALDARAATPVNDAFAFIGGAAFSGTAGELHVLQPGGAGTSFLVEGDVNGDGIADFRLIVDSALPALDASTFIA